MINQLLATLGFTEEEARAYLLLLETGPAAAGSLAKRAGIPRSSLYGFLKRLQEKGLISQSPKQGVMLFSAEQPEKIDLLIGQRAEELGRARDAFRAILPQLRELQPSALVPPRFRVFEGAAGLENALKDMLLYKDLETQAFWPIRSMLDALSPAFFRYLNKERIRNNLRTRAVWPEDQTVEVKEHPYLGVGEEFKREIRIAPKGVNAAMGYWIYGRKVAFISSRKENIGFILESAELAEMLRSQFELLWQASRPLAADEEDTRAFLEEAKRNPYLK